MLLIYTLFTNLRKSCPEQSFLQCLKPTIKVTFFTGFLLFWQYQNYFQRFLQIKD